MLCTTCVRPPFLVQARLEEYTVHIDMQYEVTLQADDMFALLGPTARAPTLEETLFVVKEKDGTYLNDTHICLMMNCP